MDLENLSEPFAVSELELIERALQSLQKARSHCKREAADSVDGEPDDVGVDERGPPSPDYSRELNGVSRLLKKVNTCDHSEVKVGRGFLFFFHAVIWLP